MSKSERPWKEARHIKGQPCMLSIWQGISCHNILLKFEEKKWRCMIIGNGGRWFWHIVSNGSCRDIRFKLLLHTCFYGTRFFTLLVLGTQFDSHVVPSVRLLSAGFKPGWAHCHSRNQHTMYVQRGWCLTNYTYTMTYKYFSLTILQQDAIMWTINPNGKPSIVSQDCRTI